MSLSRQARVVLVAVLTIVTSALSVSGALAVPVPEQGTSRSVPVKSASVEPPRRSTAAQVAVSASARPRTWPAAKPAGKSATVQPSQSSSSRARASDVASLPVGGDSYTSNTHTVRNADGSYTTRVFDGPAFHQLSPGGAWSPVNATPQVSAADPNFPVVAAGGLRPMKIGRAGSSAIALQLSKGTVTFGLPGLSFRGKPVLSGDTVTFSDVATDTDMVLGLRGDGVEESLLLKSAAAPKSVSLVIDDPSNALGGAPTVNRDGGLTFPAAEVDGLHLGMGAPYAYPQPAAGVTPVLTPGSAHLSVATAGSRYTVTEAVDTDWLSGQSYPIVLDPTITYKGPSGTYPQTDCTLFSGTHAGTNLCADTKLQIGMGGTEKRRALLQADLSAIPPGSTVTDGHFGLYMYDADSTATAHNVDIFANGQAWNTSATWNNAQTSPSRVAWTSGGGGVITGASSPFTFNGHGWYYPRLTSMVQGWVNTPSSNHGALVKVNNEGIADDYLVYSSHYANSTYWPYLAVTYTPPAAPTIVKTIAPVHPSQTGPGGAYAPGTDVKYTATITNPSSSGPQTNVEVSDPSAIGDLAGVLVKIGSGAAQVCTAISGLSCTLGSSGLDITGLTLPSAGTIVVTYQGIVTAAADAVCRAYSSTATVSNWVTGGTSSSTISPLVCDTGLGFENWWSYVTHAVGTDGVAAINAANGNLAVQQLDTPQVQARGHLSYVLRRTYNSQDTTVLSLPGSLGAGWQLNFGEAGGAIGEGLTPAGLQIPTLSGALQPQSVVLIDRDGTRHTFQPRRVGGSGWLLAATLNSSSQWIKSFTGDLNSLNLTSLLSALPTDGSYKAVCLDVNYTPPPGVHLGLFRYVATTSGSCGGSGGTLGLGNARVLGFAAVCPDRLRTEFDLTGHLMSMTDGSGVSLNYLYYGGLPHLPLPGLNVTLPALGPLAAVYQPRSCAGVTVGATVGSLNLPSSCRAFRLHYQNETSGQPPTGLLASVTDPAGRTVSYGYDTSSPPRLATVTENDGTADRSVLHYEYHQPGGSSGCTSPTVYCVLTKITDARGSSSTISYTTPTGGAQPKVAGFTDRLATPDTFSYATDGTSTTSSNGTLQIRKFLSIDAAGRAGEIQDLNSASAVIHDTKYSWDTAAATCQQPDHLVNNNLCSSTRINTSGVAPSQATASTFNDDGYPLVSSRYDPNNPSSTFTTTDGYAVQVFTVAGEFTYADTVTGGGAVTSTGGTSSGTAAGGTRIDPPSYGGFGAPQASLFTIDDHTENLSPRGNGAGSGWAPYLTSWVLDNDPTNATPNDIPPGNPCTSGVHADTGLVCEQHSPASDTSASPVPAASCTDQVSRPCDITANTYDTFGDKLTMTTPKAGVEGGASYSYSYYPPGSLDLSGSVQADGWLKAVTDPTGHFVAYGYDAAGNRVRTWDRGATSRAALPASAYPGTMSSPPSTEYSEVLYGSGSESDAITHPWRYVQSSRDPLGNTTTLVTDPNGNITTLSPPRGNPAGGRDHSFDQTATYTPDDQLATTSTPYGSPASPSQAVTSYGYDGYGNRTSSTDPNGHVTTTTYDAVNRPKLLSWTRGAYTGTPGGTMPDCTPGRATTSSDAPLPAGRILCTQTPTWNNVDEQTSLTDAAGGQTVIGYDTLGRTISSRVLRSSGATPVWEWTRTTYDADGNQLAVCEPNAFTTSATDSGSCTASTPQGQHVSYTPAGNPSQLVTYRDTSTELTRQASYDADGNVIASTDPRGYVSTATYDLLDRRTDLSVPRSSNTDTHTLHTSYDPVGDPVLTQPDFGGADANTVNATATAFDADNRATDTVTGYTGTTSDYSSIEAAARSAHSSSDGGSNTHTRTVFDADGNTSISYTARAFPAGATGSSPDERFATRLGYDAGDNPVSSAAARYDTNDAAFSDASDSRAPQQATQCPTGQTGWPATVGVCTSTASYDAAGNRTRLTLPTATGSGSSAGRYLNFEYTDDNLTCAIHSPAPQLTNTSGTSTTSSCSGDTVSTDRADAVTSFRYDGAGRLVSQIDPGTAGDGSDAARFTSSWTYNLDGTLASSSTPHNSSGAQTSSYSYDNDGQQLSTVNTKNETASTSYTLDHLALTSTDNAADQTSYSYDLAGNPARATSPNGYATYYSYTGDNLLASVIRPDNGSGTHNRSSYSYDGAGRTISTTASQVTLDANGNVTGSTNAGTQTESYYRNDRPRASSERQLGGLPATPQTITSCYDADGNPLEIFDRITAVSCTSSDALSAGNAATSSSPGHLVRGYTLDALLRSSDDGSRASSYGYDALGSLTSRIDNASANTATRTGNRVVTSYSYTDAEQPTTLTADGAGTWTTSYDHDARPASETQPLNQTEGWTFNDDNTLADQRLTHTSDQSLIAEHAYSYDQLRRQLTQVLTQPGLAGSPVTSTYSYDNADRLASYTNGTKPTVYARWDKNGNRTCYGTSCTTTPAAADSATYNPDNSLHTHWVTPSSGSPSTQTVTYNNVGDRSSDGNACYTYDGYDRTTSTYAETSGSCTGAPSITSPGITYNYDGQNRQTSRLVTGNVQNEPAGTTNLNYDGATSRTIYQTAPAGATRWIPDPTDTLKADLPPDGSGLHLLTSDGHNNTSIDTTTTGLACLTRYDPFGAPQDNDPTKPGNTCAAGTEKTSQTSGQPSTQTNTQQYRDQRRDTTTGDYQLGSRTYDPTGAVYTTPDTATNTTPANQPGIGTDPLTANTYTYVNGDPLNYSDPTGHMLSPDDCDRLCMTNVTQAKVTATSGCDTGCNMEFELHRAILNSQKPAAPTTMLQFVEGQAHTSQFDLSPYTVLGQLDRQQLAEEQLYISGSRDYFAFHRGTPAAKRFKQFLIQAENAQAHGQDLDDLQIAAIAKDFDQKGLVYEDPRTQEALDFVATLPAGGIGSLLGRGAADAAGDLIGSSAAERLSLDAAQGLVRDVASGSTRVAAEDVATGAAEAGSRTVALDTDAIVKFNQPAVQGAIRAGDRLVATPNVVSELRNSVGIKDVGSFLGARGIEAVGAEPGASIPASFLRQQLDAFAPGAVGNVGDALNLGEAGSIGADLFLTADRATIGRAFGYGGSIFLRETGGLSLPFLVVP